MAKKDLLGIYENVLRPSAEYSSIVYNTLIPDYISEKLESVQKQAVKIIFGHDINYQKMVEDKEIETLKSRRDNASLKFALRMAGSQRFERAVRQSTRNTYFEKKCRTERCRNNPIRAMTRQLNEHLKH